MSPYQCSFLQDIFEVVTTQNGGTASHALNHVSDFIFQTEHAVLSLALVTGDYDGVLNANGFPDDELVLVIDQGLFISARSFEVCPSDQSVPPKPCSFDITPKANLNLAPLAGLTGARSGRLNWFGATDQLVVAFDLPGASLVEIYTFDKDLNFKFMNSQAQPLSSIAKLAIGQFDQDLGSDLDRGIFAKAPNLQIALLQITACKTWELAIYNVEPENKFSMSEVSFSKVDIDSDCYCQLRYMQRRFNLYVYPVIRHTVCPNGRTCPPAQKHPLHVIFSGPDRITRANINTCTVEWFQLAHETGNVFSYPPNQTLLNTSRKLSNPDFDLNGTTVLGNTTFFTDSSTQKESMQWSQGGGSNISVGSSASFSFDESVSISSTFNIDIFGGGTADSFSANQSKAVNSLKTPSEIVGASTGVTITKAGNFATPPLYEYGVEGFIFGQPDPPGSFQKIEQEIYQQTTGPLEVGFTANPLQGGSWWTSSSSGSYTTAPDIALNHPVRWSFSEQAASSPRPANCIQSPQDQMDCFTFNASPDFSNQETCPNLDCMWSSEFHWMRGLLITPADADGGPQITQATAGDKLRLRARVYNYSLHQADAGVSLHARLYRQEWQPTCPDTDVDCQSNVPIGESALIEEVQTDPVDPFNEQTLNWTLLETTLDTTELGDKYFIFWVVIWLEDENGGLVAEIPQHGLKDVPGPLASIADVPIESHSNNVGYYHMPFYIFPEQSNAAPMKDPASEADVGLIMEQVTLSHSHATKNEKIEIKAILSTGDQSEDGVMVLFFDGDPDAGGEMFDMELVSHIRANEVYQLRVPFRPHTCGTHEIFVVAADGRSTSPKSMALLEVDCEPLAVIDPEGKVYLYGSIRNSATARIAGEIAYSGELNLDSATLTLNSLFKEAGTELLKTPKEDAFLPLTLEATPKGDETNAIFKTPPGEWPNIRVKISRRNDRLKFVVRVHRMTLEAPRLCQGTPLITALETGFRVEDGNIEPVEIKTAQEWVCRVNAMETFDSYVYGELSIKLGNRRQIE